MQEDITEEFVIYSGAGCSYCKQAKKLLDQKDLPYTVMDARSSAFFKSEFLDKGVRKIPQIYIGDHYIGGFDELRSYFSTQSK